MKFLMGCALALAFTASASAKIPAEVLTPYKAYRIAVEANDMKTAVKQARMAWDAAEDSLGDHKTTGDLAQNFADVSAQMGSKSRDVKKAYIRSIELASLYPDTAVDMRLMREVSLGEWAMKAGKEGGAARRLKAAAEFAVANGYDRSVYLGEIYTMLSSLNVPRRNHKAVEDYAAKALAIFENPSDNYVTYHPYMAQLYLGYGKEGNDEILPAALAYQEVMENIEGKLPEKHPFVMKALGRWMNMRDRLVREGLLETAEAQGLCQCWPYDKPRNDAVRAVKRVPPVMPRTAWQSGFSIVEFDLNDDGTVKSPRLLESWPEKIWDKASLRSVSQWEYTPRTANETDSDRTDIVATVRYYLTDEKGKIIE